LTRTGTLPTGVTFVDNSDGTATLSGTPAVGQGGVYPITITAANGVAPNATQSFVLTVNEPSKITSVDHVTFAKGTLGAFTVTTSAGQPAATALLASPNLPPGVTFADNGDGTATLSGVPIADGMYSLTITAANGVAPSATQAFTVTVTGAPTITSAPNATFVVNAPGTFTVTTIAGTPTATSLSEIGSLPDGVTFVDKGDGSATLAGTPALGTGGQYPITIKAANAAANSPTTFTLTVTELPEITSVDHATFTVGTSGTFAVSTVAGFPSATALTETGVLPGGVTFVDNGNGTATLGGTPDAGSGGSYPATFTATNSAGHTDLPFTLTVQEAPVITSADHTTFKVGAAGTFDVTTGAGFPTGPSLVKAGALPGGVTFVDNGDGTATIAGTPSAGTGGAYPITITAGNGVTTDDSQSFTLTVDQVPVITSADHVAMTANSPGTFTVTTTGFPGVGITESGSLPSGVTFTDNGDGTATLTGTPAAGTGGSYPLTLTAGNGVAPDDTQSFTLTIHQGPAITSTDHVQFTVGSAGTFAVTTTGVPNATITETGALPGGVTLVDHADGTATLAGTPASATGGTYPITLTASNGINPDAVQSFTLTVNEAPAITSADHATFTVGTAGTLTVTATGYPNASFTHSGVLPAGVALTDNNDGTATLAGTPAASTDGSYPITIFASNGVGLVATQTFTLTVIKAAQAITVTSIAPPSVAVGATYALSALSDSGLGVTYLVDAATTNSACSLATSTVSFDHAGSCVIDFNQAGDGTYAAAPQVQQVIAVSTVATNVAVVTPTPSTVFGQATHATATISADSGTPAGTVQFAIDGNSLGAPVTVSGGGAVSPDLTGAGGSALAPGSYSVTAAFTPDDATTYASSQGVATQIVNQAGTTLALSVHSTTVTATVTAVAPGAGAPTGSVAFAVGGLSVGTATVSGGVATLSYPVPAGKTQQVAATYAGDIDFTGSSTSTARNDPTLTATISSAHGKTRYGWYRSAVTVTFRCTSHGAPLTAACPAAVHLTRSGAGQSVTRTIKATDGGVNTVVVKGINIDLVRPTVKVTGIKNNAAYNGRAPAAHCVAKDSLSGVASCTITRHVSGAKTSYKATATDRAGNAASVSGSYSVFTNSLAGAKFENGAFDVKLGHTYTLVVYASSRPTYYDAAPYPQRPTKRDTAMRSAGHGRWTLGVTMTRSLSHYKYWNLGVKIGPTIHVIKIRVS
ncbi:MAG: Ig family protein, partial [Jatrophihabitans sp.]|nr:Ig family protein [Jatrophihabitans sp.]